MSPSVVTVEKHTLEAVVREAEHAFESERLQYVKIDEADEEIKAFIPRVENEPLMQALASPDLLRPKGKKDVDWYAEQQAKAFLGVAICLRASDEGDKGMDRKDEKDNNDIKHTKDKRVIIGTMCLGWGGIPQAMAHHRTATMGITLASGHQNKGYGREALNWLLDWGFKHAGLHTMNLCTFSYNDRAAHLYEDMGFRLEGRKREVVWFNRQWHDELWYGMTEHEWEKLRGYA